MAGNQGLTYYADGRAICMAQQAYFADHNYYAPNIAELSLDYTPSIPAAFYTMVSSPDYMVFYNYLPCVETFSTRYLTEMKLEDASIRQLAFNETDFNLYIASMLEFGVPPA